MAATQCCCYSTPCYTKARNCVPVIHIANKGQQLTNSKRAANGARKWHAAISAATVCSCLGHGTSADCRGACRPRPPRAPPRLHAEVGRLHRQRDPRTCGCPGAQLHRGRTHPARQCQRVSQPRPGHRRRLQTHRSRCPRLRRHARPAAAARTTLKRSRNTVTATKTSNQSAHSATHLAPTSAVDRGHRD
jgi:hypothetical protein